MSQMNAFNLGKQDTPIHGMMSLNTTKGKTMGAHRVIPDDRPGQVWWFHGNSGSGKTNIALKFDVPNKIVLDGDDFRESVWDDLGFDEKNRRTQNDRLAKMKVLWIQGKNVVIEYLSLQRPEKTDKRRDTT